MHERHVEGDENDVTGSGVIEDAAIGKEMTVEGFRTSFNVVMTSPEVLGSPRWKGGMIGGESAMGC